MSKVFVHVGDEEVFPVCRVSFWDADRKEHVRAGRDPADYSHHYRALDNGLVDEHQALYDEFMEVDGRLRRAFGMAKPGRAS